MNLQRQRGRGPRPHGGDIFTMLLPDGDYLIGRVIDGPLPRERAPMPGAYLVYIYGDRHSEPSADPQTLRPTNLLVAPAFVNQLGWTKGYFVAIDNQPVAEGDLLPRHCFRRSNGTYLDERARTLPGPLEPCGEWGLGNHRTLDDEISEALGIPLAPTAD